MKKIFYISLIALTTLVACNKKNSTPVEKATSAIPAWFCDESLPVPIQFGAGDMGTTKGTAIDQTAFEGTVQNPFTYDVYAAKATDTSVPMHGFTGGLLAKNVASTELPSATIVAFNDGVTRYYPYLAKDGAFNFYGYRYDGTHQTLTDAGVIEDLEIGQEDVIWAMAEVTSAQLTALQTVNANVTDGFNARYIRAALEKSTTAGVVNYTTYYSYLPKLTFEHKTSQIQFAIRAYNQHAYQTLQDASITIEGLYVDGIPVSADFNVLTGTFTATTPSAGDKIDVENAGTVVVADLPYPADPNDSTDPGMTGIACGDPIFIIPIEEANASLHMVLSITLPGYDDPEEIEMTINAPTDDGFEEGKAYKFTIVLQSIEKITIQTELTDWGTPINAGEVVIE